MIHGRTLLMLVLFPGVVAAAESKGKALPAAVREIVANADSLEVLSLDPGTPGRPAAMPVDAFHGWAVLGRTTIPDVRQRQAIVAGLERGVVEGDMPMRCFEPRHGIRAKRGKTVADLVICFACRQIATFVGDQETGTVLTSASPKGLLDAPLRTAKIPLAGEPKR